jgi:hypothetical protein
MAENSGEKFLLADLAGYDNVFIQHEPFMADKEGGPNAYRKENGSPRPC